MQFLNGELKLEEAIFYAQRNTRHYAKRQMTWFRQEAGMEWFSGFGDDPQIQQAVERSCARISGVVPQLNTARFSEPRNSTLNLLLNHRISRNVFDASAVLLSKKSQSASRGINVTVTLSHTCAALASRYLGADCNDKKETLSMINRILVLFTVLALAGLASAKSYSLTLFEPSVIGGTELKPGDYTLELKDEKVVIKKGKQMGEAAVKVETADSKYSTTSCATAMATASTTSRRSISAAPI